MDIKVLLQAFDSIWFIEPNAAEHYALIAHQILIGERKSFYDDEDEPEEYAWTVDASGKRIGSAVDAVDNGVAVLNLRGAVMKYDYCGSPGTQSLINALQQANDNPAISAILLQIDSPGGAVDGTEQLASAVKNSEKPVQVFVNGKMCSAAAWIGSGAKGRIASSNTDIIGSIGTMAAWRDFKGYYEQMGIKSHEVYATASTQKNLPFREAGGNNADGKTNYEPLIKTWLDPTNEVFMNAIQENLPNADKTVLSGATYIASDAKKKGLIDSIGTFQDAVNAAIKLGNKKQKTQTEYFMKFPKIAAVLGFKAEDKTETIALAEKGETLEALVSERDTLLADKTALQLQVTNLTTENSTQKTTISTLTSDKAKLETKVTALEALDGTKPTATTEQVDTVAVAKDVDPNAMAFQKEIYASL